MNYKYKYQKYKNKYLELIKQKGGNLPLDNYLKNINLFENDTDIEKYLNPFYGYIWINYGVINNYYRFYNEYSENNDYISYLTHRTFFMIGNTILPTNKLDKINIKDYAHLIGNLYLLKNDVYFISLMKLLYKLNLFIKSNKTEKTEKTHKNINKLLYILYNFYCDNKDKDETILKLIKLLFKNIQKYLSKNSGSFKNIINTVNLLIIKINTITELKKIKNNEILNLGLINENLIYYNLNDINIFHWLSTLLFYKLNNKTIIREYYEELNKILTPKEKVIINSDFNSSYTVDELSIITLDQEKIELQQANMQNYMSYAIIMLKRLYSLQLNLLRHRSCAFLTCEEGFSDCVETSLRNFINILIYDFNTDTFDLSKLHHLEPNEKLRKYYEIFNTYDKQNDDDKTLYFLSKYLGPREAWLLVVSNLPNVKYKKECSLGFYEIISVPDLTQHLKKPTDNIFKVLSNLFNNISDWKSFEINGIIIEEENEDINSPKIIIKNQDINYIWEIQKIHSQIKFERKNTMKTEDFVFFPDDSKLKFYEDVFHNYDELYLKYSKINKWYYYNLNSNEKIVKIFNICDNLIDDDEYTNIFEYIIMNFNDDFKDLCVNISKIKRFLLKNHYIIGNIKYHDNNKSWNNIKEIDIKINFKTKNLFDLINLIPNILKLKINYNNEQINILPSSITHLHIELTNYKIIENLPINLTYLSFGYYFNQSVDNLPLSLTHLIFSYMFNQSVNKLPEKITHLTFGFKFNQLVDNLPLSLTHLTFGYKFNQLVDNLPENLTHLTFGEEFNQPINKLPENLTHLILGNDFYHNINILPKKLTHLTLSYNYWSMPDYLPDNLTHLTFGYEFNADVDFLPKNLSEITFGHDFNQPVEFLPKTLTKITFGNNFYYNIRNLPPCLTHLIFKFDNLELFLIPDREKKEKLNFKIIHSFVNFSNEYKNTKEIIQNSLNDFECKLDFSELTQLTFGDSFNQTDDLSEFINLTHLTFGYNFNQYIDLSKLTNLTHLTFGSMFNQNIDLGELKNLTHLTFGSMFNQNIDLSKLTNLTHLTIFNLSKKMINDIKKLKNLSYIKTQYKYLIPIYYNNKNILTVDFDIY
jgi:hypothetical protein